MAYAILRTFILLLMGHALGDFPLQGEYIAQGKNRHAAPPGYDPAVHGKRQAVWPFFMAAHALIHGLIVFTLTARFDAAIWMVLTHGLIDLLKSERIYSPVADQVLHGIVAFSLAILVNLPSVPRLATEAAMGFFIVASGLLIVLLSPWNE